MRTFVSIFSLVLFFFLNGCNSNQSDNPNKETPTSGTIHISIDETFKPVMEEQIRIFELSNPSAHIIATYKSEADCFRDFFNDSANRMVIVGRALTSKEEKSMIRKLGFNPGCNAIASDAVAVLVNANSKDTIFTLSDLKNALQGKKDTAHRTKTFVFDGLNATSTVRFIRDSILKGEVYDTAVVKATKNSKDVITYVAQHSDAVGLVGFSWIGNPEDSAQVKLLQTVKIAYIQCDICENKPFVKPMQESMITKRYPLVRSMYYILKENFGGLGTGFVSFLKYERGQLIFKRAYLDPVMDFEVRNVKISGQEEKK